MKKSKLSLGLVTSFIGALALTSCNTTTTVTKDDKSIVDFIGYNAEDEKINIDIDKFYSEYGDSEEGTTLFYNAVLEALIRYEYKGLSEKEGSTLKAYTTLVKEAEDKVKAQKQAAQDNANNSGKTYAEEWEAILDSHDCENEEDLKQYFLYELEKEAINDWYFSVNQASLKDQYIGVDKDWKVIDRPVVDGKDTHEFESVYPYHILHVLVKLGADATDYSRATITADEAEKLWNVVRKLMDSSYSFEDVAKSESDDSSNTAYGDVGIMSTQTSFYNEFKLGIYAYDALLSGVNTEDTTNKAIYKAFGVDSDAKVTTSIMYDTTSNSVVETKESVDGLINKEMVLDVRNAVTGYGATAASYSHIPTIPYDVFRKIGQYKDDEKMGTVAPEAGAVAYPRNVLFNQFLNFRSPFVISGEDITIAEGSEQVTVTNHDFVNGDFKLPNNNFVNNAVVSTGSKNILTDGTGNVIIGVRSSAGIHFMVMRKSVFYNTNLSVATSATTTKADVSLQDYYTTDIPGSANYPAETYVNMTQSDDSTYYTNRANTIKNKLKGQDSSDVFDAAYDYRIYQMLFENVKDKIEFFDKDENNNSVVMNNILKKIQLLREGKALSNEDMINDAWESYLAQLRHQNNIREYKGMLSTGCVFRWGRANASDLAAFEKGGECYVK